MEAGVVPVTLPQPPRTPRTAKKRTEVSTRLGWPDRFLRQLKVHGAISAAAKASNVGRTTVYKQMGEDPEFQQQVRDVLAECVEEVEATLYRAALNPDKTTDRIFYLKSRKPAVYGDKLSPEQLAEIRAQITREVQAQLEDEIAELPPRARQVVMAAIRKRQELNA